MSASRAARARASALRATAHHAPGRGGRAGEGRYRIKAATVVASVPFRPERRSVTQ